MNKTDQVVVASRSFSRNPTLRNELLNRYQHVKFNDEGATLVDDALVSFCKGATKAIVGLEPISRTVLSRLPELKVIGKYGVGVDKIDLQAMTDLGVHLGWTPGVNRLAVAELALCFMLAGIRLVPQANALVRGGGWSQVIGKNLSGKKIGIVGCGNVGKELVRLLEPFRCQVLVFDKVHYADFYREHNCEAVSLEVLLRNSDVVSIHLPLTSETRLLFSAEKLQCLQPGSVLINTSRGGIVDEDSLHNLLKNRSIAGACFDVFDREPPQDKELLNLPNFFCTPHIGGSSEEAILAMGQAAIEGLDRFGKPFDVVSLSMPSAT
jgi:phosphoglycerate dehydrogenase-like enzyme